MTEIIDYPPNYPAIRKAFPQVSRNRVLFAWGDDIYNPHNAKIPGPLKAHEAMHGRRQKLFASGIEGWWRHYMADRDFRLMEEIVAHRVEYLITASQSVMNRHQRRGLLKTTAKRLAHPMYEFGLSNAHALRVLRDNPRKEDNEGNTDAPSGARDVVQAAYDAQGREVHKDTVPDLTEGERALLRSVGRV